MIICGEYPLSRSNQLSKELIAVASKSFYDYYSTSDIGCIADI
ncbi:hypothetical protein ANACOL_01706 [Anaerotruncus colihominis DSM 17241]|uniref:Uncharacterized protein n=1 Tax=Anaerotruncus colihominis DSM 17241 TaxID=445972 RepID=B0P9N7_9FIRM|nr:hypothetical protein ANACOL_01706 [Anaerotruncus colihominis DSM 17241]